MSDWLLICYATGDDDGARTIIVRTFFHHSLIPFWTHQNQHTIIAEILLFFRIKTYFWFACCFYEVSLLIIYN